MKPRATVPNLVRRTGFIPPKVELVVACEGRNTEPRYFRDCIEHYGAGLVRLRVLDVVGVPMTIVRAAIEEREALLARYRRSANSFDACFRVWAVFDRDEHPRVEEALAVAREKGVEVAFSNPCFELWPLLHLEDYGAQDSRHALQVRLNAKMPRYHHERSAEVDFSAIREAFPTALHRANALLAAREAEGVPLGCPSTTVGGLVLKIIQNGKAAYRATSFADSCRRS
jgi:hypothetical protein